MKKSKAKKSLLLGIIIILLILFMVPFYVLIVNTFKSTSDFVRMPFSLPESLNFDNYKVAIERMNFANSFKNTAIITIVATIINSLVGSMTGYFFARKDWKINKLIFTLFLASMVAPFQVYMIPLVKIYGGTLGMANKLSMVIYISIGMNIPFAVFLYNGFVEGIPIELDEAAKIDGCGITRTFFYIIAPILKPIMVTVVSFVSLGVWNDYLMTRLFLTREKTKTLSIAAFTFLTNHSADYSPMMAGLVLSIIPVLLFYLFGQKYIISGVVSGSVKG